MVRIDVRGVVVGGHGVIFKIKRKKTLLNNQKGHHLPTIRLGANACNID